MNLLAAWSPFVLAAALAAQTAPPDELACRVCHPGAVRGLAASPHAPLAQRTDLAGRVCAACHGELTAHANAAGHDERPRAPVPPVAAAVCANCHAAPPPPARGAHPFAAVLPDPPGAPRAATLALERRDAATGLAWSGLADLGYRFVHLVGSSDGYATDVDLDAGVVLRDFELRGAGGPAAPLDRVSLRLSDFGDPRWNARAGLGAGAFALDTGFSRSRYLYAADGDFHRVDRSSDVWRTDARVPLGGGVELFASHGHREDDGFWLVQRIGERNVPVQTFVDGVRSPRTRRTDDGELGLRGEHAGLRWLVAAGQLDEHGEDRWSWSRPAPANPAFPEAEDLADRDHLRGPTVRARLGRTFGPLSLDAGTTVRDLRRTTSANGTSSGYDVEDFTATTDGTGSSTSRSSLHDLTATLPCSESASLTADLHYADREDHLRLHQLDVRTYPTLGTTTTTTDVDDTTVQRTFEGELRLDTNPCASLDLTVGWAHTTEQLRVPDLAPADPGDFRRGHVHDDGPLADLRYRFAPDWTLRAEGRDVDSGGATVHELAPGHSRTARASLGWQHGDDRASAWASHRRDDNDVSGHHLENWALGLDGGLSLAGVLLAANWSYAHTDSRTPTDFYFDPDPTPRPTLVGYRGGTHTAGLSATWTRDRLRAEASLGATRTRGDFDVDTFDLRADLRWRCTEHGSAGCEWRHVEYRDGGGGDDWTADLVFVYWRQEW